MSKAKFEAIKAFAQEKKYRLTWVLVLGLLIAPTMFTSAARADSFSQAPGKPSASATSPVISYLPGSTVKLEQLLGEEDKELHQSTLSQTFTRYGIQVWPAAPVRPNTNP